MRQEDTVPQSTAFKQDLGETYPSDDFIEDLRGLVWAKSSSHTWNALAGLARLSPSTVAKFAYGETKKPHANTIVRLVYALGYRLAVVKMDIGRVQGEIELQAYRGLHGTR